MKEFKEIYDKIKFNVTIKDDKIIITKKKNTNIFSKRKRFCKHE